VRDTEAVAVERVRLDTLTVTHPETVGGQVRKEEIELDTDDRNPHDVQGEPADQLDHRVAGSCPTPGPRTTSTTPTVPTANHHNQHLTRGTT
jgi:Domain of unknown function (DUF2382)